MNKRIKELLNEATSGHEQDLSLQRTVTADEMEKFAELIVQECIDNIKVWELDSRNHISYMLERHFGVEE